MTAELFSTVWMRGPAELMLWTKEIIIIEDGDTVTYYVTTDGSMILADVVSSETLLN